MTPEMLETFAKYGGLIGLLMGVIILGTGTAVVFLWRHNASLQQQLTDTQNKRVQEAIEVRAELLEQGKDTSDALNATANAMQALKEAVLFQNRSRE